MATVIRIPAAFRSVPLAGSTRSSSAASKGRGGDERERSRTETILVGETLLGRVESRWHQLRSSALVVGALGKTWPVACGNGLPSKSETAWAASKMSRTEGGSLMTSPF